MSNNCIAVFLDVDGVLNTDIPTSTTIEVGRGLYLNEDLLDNFVRLYKKYGFSVILSSTWRSFANTKKTIKHILHQRGVPIVGYTKQIGKKENWNKNRDVEISEWVHRNQPCGWIALDDLPLNLPIKNFVHTNSTLGFLGSKKKEFEVKIKFMLDH